VTRRLLLGNAHLQFALTVLIVVLANLWSSNHFLRADITSNRLHSLDESSKRLAGKLERPMSVRVYFTRGLEAPYNNHEQAVRDKLEEFRAYAHGRMQITVVDPTGDASRIEEAQSYGLTPLEYTVRKQDRAELRTVWMGAVFIYGDRTEVLPSLTQLASLEYDVSSAIRKLEQPVKDRPVIAYSTGHGEPDLSKPDGPMRALVEGMARKAYLVPVQLGGEGLLAEEVDALLVIGPQTVLSDRALYQIDQFVMRGGAAAFFVTNTRPDMRTLRTERVNSGLDPLLGAWGVRMNRDVVLDRVQNGAMRFPVRVGGKSGSREINYPLILRSTDLSQTSVLTAGMDSLLVPFAASVELSEPLPEGVLGTVLARSSAASGAVPSLRELDPTQFDKVIEGERRGPFNLIVAMTGAWRSFFETRPVPAPDAEVADEQEGMGRDAPTLTQGAPTRIVVAASADVVANNSTFVLNLCDWLVQDESLIGIRSKRASVVSLAPTTAGERSLWRAFNLLFGPVVLLAAGGARQLWLRRRAGAAGA
jgi:gliding-associated putative ABC transporter substrate-binding component GldG